ncbi:MAG: hypothetical protein NT080_07010 [Spirochaetes bacterium]|nr:hypothetical protein [Spirochaetota bacterium]
MKYKTFRAIAITALVVGVGGGSVLGVRACGSRPRRDFAGSQPGAGTGQSTTSTPQPATPGPSAPQRDLAAGEQALREMDRAILDLLDKPMSGERIKDAFPSRSYKVNVYKDSGFAQANRLKIDFDRDEKDDEKWTLEGFGPGLKVKRQVAPKDDADYSEEYRLLGGAWAPKE